MQHDKNLHSTDLMSNNKNICLFYGLTVRKFPTSLVINVKTNIVKKKIVFSRYAYIYFYYIETNKQYTFHLDYC